MNPFARHKARKLALQAIYQWQITQDQINDISAQHLAEANPKKIDFEYFIELVNGVTTNVAELDKQLQPILDRECNNLDEVELAVLRLAFYELIYRLDVPYKVVIDEALELTKTFGSVDGFKYVNGVLDKFARQVRTAEVTNKKENSRKSTA